MPPVESIWQQAALGAAGGIALEVLHWYSLSRAPGRARRFAKGVVYWVATAFMVGLGALMPLLYVSGSASALLCFHLGAATPLLLQKLTTAVPKIAQPQGMKEEAPALRDFFSW
ncbi:MAG: hypothetical protein L6R30_01855 [Thermoanaerobaculia bacterium]|nr:hypothetical protein [Thermoanaerobaculia bacterium]